MNRVLYVNKSCSYASNDLILRGGSPVGFRYTSFSLFYASKGITDTNDLLSPFFWNFTTPSTFACKV